MDPVSLPQTHQNLQGSQFALAAYARLLPLEPRHDIAIRVSGWMLIHAPTAAGQAYVARCINDCDNDDEVVAASERFIIYFTKYFKATLHKPTPTPSDHPSRPDLDALRNQILASLIETPHNHKEAKKLSLIRDDYRCMLSGVVDSRSHRASRRLWNTPGIIVEPTECSHILPQYLGYGLGDPYRLDASANVWTVLQCFGGVQADELNGPAMHNLRNILTLQTGCHTSFDSLQIWLDPIDGTEDQYAIGRYHSACHAGLPATVTFTSTSPQLALPDRRYLALHAACAKVVNMSGAGELIDRILDDAAETKVLSEDGSSGELLVHLLSMEAGTRSTE